VEDYGDFKHEIYGSKVDKGKGLLIPIMDAQYYSLQNIHTFAKDWEGGEMKPYDVILKTRPDVRISHSFNVSLLIDYFSRKENQDVLLAFCHANAGWWKQDRISDVVFITSRAAYDRIEWPLFARWFEEEVKHRNLYGENGNPPEHIFKVFIEESVKLRIVFANPNVGVGIVRTDGKVQQLQGSHDPSYPMMSIL